MASRPGDPLRDAAPPMGLLTAASIAEEMAYVLLEECAVELVGCGTTGGDKEARPQWIVVDQLPGLQQTRSGEQNLFDGATVDEESSDVGNETDFTCHRCNLVLCKRRKKGTDEDLFHLNWKDVQPFNGTVQDCFAVKSERASSPSSDRPFPIGGCGCQMDGQPRRQRTDAALLAGLLVVCSPHVSVVRCNVLFHETNRVSLLFTLAFPTLSQSSTTKQSIIAKSPSLEASPSKRTRSSAPGNKVLNPALQLLLMLARSDWDRLEKAQADLLDRGLPSLRVQSHRERPSFFPSKLTLGALYERMQATSESNNANGTKSMQKMRDIKPAPLVDLPTELLVDRIAPFLQATDLAAIRSTCHFMYSSLRGVVPGLRLRLYSHQRSSLSWMRRREASLLENEADCLQTPASIGTTVPDGDVHRAVTGGTTVVLATRSAMNQVPRSVRVDVRTGDTISLDEQANALALPRRVARGGLLCDDPGLGKTITVLALILQTFGLSADLLEEDRKRRPANASLQVGPHDDGASTVPDEDEALFLAYWSERVVAEYRRPPLLTMINDLRYKMQVGHSNPFAMIQKAVMSDGYGADFSAFERDVKDVLADWPSDPHCQLQIFEELLRDFKETQMRSARKSFSNAKSKPNSRVAALIEEEAHRRLLCSLVPSNGTLLVIPSVLMEHWKNQINLHVDLSYCTDKIPLVFEHKKKESPDMTVDKATILCQLRQTHAPMVFLDYGGRPLPPAEFLAQFQIVITTTLRFMNEAKKGSFQDELDRQRLDSYADNEDEVPVEACELLKVHWSRMVVDEGHSMGNDKTNSTIQFASWVRAKRRWAMTGTPTKQNAAQIGQLLGLTRFLQHDFFSSRLEGDLVWKRAIAKGWRDGELASFFRLRSLFLFLMKRHTKSDVAELMAPVFRKSHVSMSYLEATTYNTIVSAVQANLLLTSMNAKTSGQQDSLLSRRQAKHARLVIQNCRRVCTGWSRVVPVLDSKLFQETMIMAQELGIPQGTIDKITEYIWRAQNEELTPCSFCAMRVSTLLLMPCCGGLICTECLDNSASSCYLCEGSFDVDELQKLQPGFALDWRLNIESKKKSPPVAAQSTPTIPIANDIWNAQGEQAQDPNPLLRPHVERRRKNKLGDGHECVYDRYAASGRCILCLEEHNHCCLLNEMSRCEVCHRLAEACPDSESKSSLLIQRLLDLHKTQSGPAAVPLLGDEDSSDLTRPLKVIVFSQFRASLNVVGDRLLNRFGTACIAEYAGSHRKQELHKFTHDPICFCLLLTKDGSEGLDLSFVTHIVFFEEIYDKSLQDQAVARAWRMGAKGQVEVETLIASHSLEEILGNRSGSDDDDETGTKSGGEHQRIKFLLESLRYITDYHHFALSNEATAQSDNKAPVMADGKPNRKRPANANVLLPSTKRAKVTFAAASPT